MAGNRHDSMISASSGGIEIGRYAVTSPYHHRGEPGMPNWLLFCTHAGRGRIGHAEGELAVLPGTVALIAPHAFNDYGVEPTLRRWRFDWAYFAARPGWEPWLSWPEAASGLAMLTPAAERFTAVAAALTDAFEYASMPGRTQAGLTANAVERALLLLASELPADRLDSRVAAAIEICRHEFADRLTLASLARRTGTSISRLTGLFRAQTGCSIRAYIERLRLEQARTLLRHSALSVSEIASRCGFPDPFYFSQRFHRVIGQAPSLWREEGKHATPSS